MNGGEIPHLYISNENEKSIAAALDVANDRVSYRGGYMNMPTHEAVYMVIMKTVFPDGKVVSGFSKHSMTAKSFLPEDVTVPGIPNSPKDGKKDKRPQLNIKTRRENRCPDVINAAVAVCANEFQAKLNPNASAPRTTEEDVMPRLLCCPTAHTGAIVEDVFVGQGTSRTKPVLEVEPSKNLHLRWHLGPPDLPPMEVSFVASGVQRRVGGPSIVWLASAV
jgi:hypothetical protein